VNFVFSTISKELKKNRVTLIGFGTFEVEKKEGQKGRNPQTGEDPPMVERQRKSPGLYRGRL